MLKKVVSVPYTIYPKLLESINESLPKEAQIDVKGAYTSSEIVLGFAESSKDAVVDSSASLSEKIKEVMGKGKDGKSKDGESKDGEDQKDLLDNVSNEEIRTQLKDYRSKMYETMSYDENFWQEEYLNEYFKDDASNIIGALKGANIYEDLIKQQDEVIKQASEVEKERVRYSFLSKFYPGDEDAQKPVFIESPLTENYDSKSEMSLVDWNKYKDEVTEGAKDVILQSKYYKENGFEGSEMDRLNNIMIDEYKAEFNLIKAVDVQNPNAEKTGVMIVPAPSEYEGSVSDVYHRRSKYLTNTSKTLKDLNQEMEQELYMDDKSFQIIELSANKNKKELSSLFTKDGNELSPKGANFLSTNYGVDPKEVDVQEFKKNIKWSYKSSVDEPMNNIKSDMDEGIPVRMEDAYDKFNHNNKKSKKEADSQEKRKREKESKTLLEKQKEMAQKIIKAMKEAIKKAIMLAVKAMQYTAKGLYKAADSIEKSMFKQKKPANKTVGSKENSAFKQKTSVNKTVKPREKPSKINDLVSKIEEPLGLKQRKLVSNSEKHKDVVKQEKKYVKKLMDESDFEGVANLNKKKRLILSNDLNNTVSDLEKHDNVDPTRINAYKNLSNVLSGKDGQDSKDVQMVTLSKQEWNDYKKSFESIYKNSRSETKSAVSKFSNMNIDQVNLKKAEFKLVSSEKQFIESIDERYNGLDMVEIPVYNLDSNRYSSPLDQKLQEFKALRDVTNEQILDKNGDVSYSKQSGDKETYIMAQELYEDIKSGKTSLSKQMSSNSPKNDTPEVSDNKGLFKKKDLPSSPFKGPELSF